MTDSSNALIVLCLSFPFVVIPCMVGVALLLKKGALAHFAGWLTLKPVLGVALMSVLWVRAGPNDWRPQLLYLAMVIGLTALIAGVFRGVVFRPRAYAAWTLLVLDVIRWGSTLATTWPYERVAQGIVYVLLSVSILLLALAMPAIFAIAAAVISLQARAA